MHYFTFQYGDIYFLAEYMTGPDEYDIIDIKQIRSGELERIGYIQVYRGFDDRLSYEGFAQPYLPSNPFVESFDECNFSIDRDELDNTKDVCFSFIARAVETREYFCIVHRHYDNQSEAFLTSRVEFSSGGTVMRLHDTLQTIFPSDWSGTVTKIGIRMHR